MQAAAAGGEDDEKTVSKILQNRWVLLVILVVTLIGGLAGLTQAIETGFSLRSNKLLINVIVKLEKEVIEMGQELLEMKKERLRRHGQ